MEDPFSLESERQSRNRHDYDQHDQNDGMMQGVDEKNSEPLNILSHPEPLGSDTQENQKVSQNMFDDEGFKNEDDGLEIHKSAYYVEKEQEHNKGSLKSPKS